MSPAHQLLRIPSCILALAGALHGQQDPSNSTSPATGAPERSQIEVLRERIEALEGRLGAHATEPGERAGAQAGLDLSERQLPSITETRGSNPLSRPWFENIEVSGFGAFSYLDTGSAGARPHGGFLLQEASIFLDAQAWEQADVHFDIQAAPLGVGASEQVGIGELYGNLKNLWTNPDGDHIGLKAGRFYVPFGEEYTWTRAPDNPLLSNSAPDPYGLAQGVQLYGSWGKLGWIAALSDGAEELDAGDHLAKALNLKVWGEPAGSVHLSASFMLNGKTDKSALEFGGSNLQPVGADGSSSAGASPSTEIRAQLGELDAKLRLRSDASLALAFGAGKVDDAVDTFDRNLKWFRFEPRCDLSESVFAVLRVSEIGTYDAARGYHFDGEILAEGNDAFGYDTKRFQRLSLGLGWKINPHALAKIEVGRDRFWVISSSPISASADDRTFFGSELVLSF